MRLAALCLAVAIGASGCSCGRTSGSGGGTDAAATGSVGSTAPRPRPSDVPRNPEPPAKCRAIGVAGSILTAEGKVLASNDELTDAWLALDDGATFTAKDPRTARETTFRGKGSARACVGAEQESWLASGTFESAPGAGEAPGNEEWVMTPLGAVRYIAAGLRLAVSSTPPALDVKVDKGAAYVLPASDALARWDATTDGGAPRPGKTATGDAQGWIRVNGGGRLLLGGPAPAKAGLRVLASDCRTLATQAHTLSDAVLNPARRGDAGFADVAQENVVMRRRARGACGVAKVRARTLPASEHDDALERELDESDATWRKLGT
jgi:hypothetical protein